uniref:Uncharacterized protein n=1 Tax=Anguilla anguilla TaxID=7936 RepID=A0A0E9SF50_ANGAN
MLIAFPDLEFECIITVHISTRFEQEFALPRRVQKL